MFRFYTMPEIPAKRGRMAAWLVHAYTASGAVAGFVGLQAAAARDPKRAFAAMFVATLIDATDGMLARRAHVKAVLPDVDGARIDDLVDYLTFVVLPMFLAVEVGMISGAAALPVAAIVLLASMYGFVAPDAKTADHFFTGFPSYWNIVVLYLYVLGPTPAVNAAVLLVLAALVFVRIGYVYPSRTPQLQRVTLLFGSAWAIAVADMVWRLPDRAVSLAILSLVFPVYYTVLSLVLHVRRRRA